MSALQKCHGVECDIRERCRRFVEPAELVFQSYIDPDVKGTECVKYEPIGVEEGDGS